MFCVGLDTSALDDGFKAHALRGTGRYVSELSRYFKHHPHESVSVTPFSHSEILRGSRLAALSSCLPAGRVTFRQQLAYPLALAGDCLQGIDILHFPAHVDAPTWSSKRTIVTVLDLIPVVLSELYAPEKHTWRFRLARWLELRAITQAELVLAISEHTAQDVQRVLGVPREKIVVTPLGVDERFFAPSDGHGFIQKYSLPPERPKVLYVGGIDQRKNISVMFQAFRIVVDTFLEQGKTPPLLVLAGDIQRDEQYGNLNRLRASLSLEDHIFEVGFVPDEELPALYQLADVFFFPSLYEGFGLPPLEAMASGTPVVSSNSSCLPEVLGDAALFFSPQDADGASEALITLLERPELSTSQSEAGRLQARKFPWNETARLTSEAYLSLAESRHQLCHKEAA
ncbi:MAG: glycosyltransferase family 4 protein [Bdellovibrionales bacterium]|nr:glycosyltransferase family 4 protein [Bdellovibrionales bacterium]